MKKSCHHVEMLTAKHMKKIEKLMLQGEQAETELESKLTCRKALGKTRVK